MLFKRNISLYTTTNTFKPFNISILQVKAMTKFNY